MKSRYHQVREYIKSQDKSAYIKKTRFGLFIVNTKNIFSDGLERVYMIFGTDENGIVVYGGQYNSLNEAQAGAEQIRSVVTIESEKAYWMCGQ